MNWYKQKQKRCEELADLFETRGDSERSKHYTQEAENYKYMAEEYS